MIALAFGLLDDHGTYGAVGRVGDAASTAVGSCLRDPTGDQSIGTQVDCAQTHDAEVYLAGNLGSDPWPGGDTIDGRADDICYHGFQGYVGTTYDSSDYDYNYYLPDQAEWASGEHRVVCVVEPGFQDSLRGSVRSGD